MRTDTKKQGRVTTTEQELRKLKKGITPGTGGSGASLRKHVVSLTTTDFTADGSLYRLDVYTTFLNDDYIYQIYETDDGSEALPHKVSRETPYLKVWFATNSKNYTFIFIG